ncbi:MAG: hypothetical protein AAFR18_11670 [Cyanobacteria bacterium J06627_32]
MVPDFSGVRKHSNALAAVRSLEPNHSAASRYVKSFFVQHFSEKVLLPEQKSLPFCSKHIHGAAKPIGFVANSLQNKAPQTAAIPSPTPAVCQTPDDTAHFYELWTALPSWSPIIKKADGWITIVNSSGKKVPLVLGTVESHYRRRIILGKRFGKLTNYLMIDIDINSPFHPRNGGIEKILAAMESLGLCRFLLIRSSVSGGLHIYFPLAEPVSSWAIACAAHAALTAAGITVAGGICELFPNKKAFNAEHNGHRLPLQDGSFILDSDFRCIGNSKAVFLRQWQLCTARQGDKQLTEALTEKHKPLPKPVSVGALPPIAWTDQGQSNDIMRQLVNYGDAVMGHKTIPALGDWIVAVAPQLPGFLQFASEESRNDLTRRNWAYRWAKSHFKAGRLYAAKASSNHNAVVAAEALERLRVALEKLVVVGKLGIKKLWHQLSDISRELFGVGFGWKLFQKHRALILERVSSSCNVGLSTGKGEGKKLSSSESAISEVTGAGKEPKKHLAELSTARCVTSTKNTILSASTPPSGRADLGDSNGTELAMGTAVYFQQSGSGVEKVETVVTGEAQPLSKQDGVIRATAAQLLQVLGKACPFVGPGLWAVRRDGVSPLAWGQLMRLAEES